MLLAQSTMIEYALFIEPQGTMQIFLQRRQAFEQDIAARIVYKRLRRDCYSVNRTSERRIGQ